MSRIWPRRERHCSLGSKPLRQQRAVAVSTHASTVCSCPMPACSASRDDYQPTFGGLCPAASGKYPGLQCCVDGRSPSSPRAMLRGFCPAASGAQLRLQSDVDGAPPPVLSLGNPSSKLDRVWAKLSWASEGEFKFSFNSWLLIDDPALEARRPGMMRHHPI
uniref:Uncharacterized protein n=1 Tax=Mycena chlorophos TaxID=658473 RepID=A0ABQ0L2R9_MYCCL|nr:predicted protein [Mycena chlorophos]